ncbi:LysM peptidoglycan-binding domain-containing protein [Geothermobacter hydrogeniphilus]|nr:LysM peptidoglycan-binding domain-containing protein [Geothermobacter hydrogeniphilus]
MVVRILFVFSLILLGGCGARLSAPSPEVKAAAAAVSGGAAAEARQTCDISSLEAARDRMSLLPGDFVLADRALLESEEPSSTFDLETLADTLLLTGFDQHPPENEGLTTPASGELFDFPVVENAKVKYFIDYYTHGGRKGFVRWLARSGRYLPRMRAIFAEQGLPRDLAYLAMVESGFNERAYSWANAVGPWQFIEKTGSHYGLKTDWWRDERRDFEKSTYAAARFLADLRDRFDGNWYLAVAAYNAGGGKISRAVRKYKSTDFWDISRGNFLQPETRNYVPKLLAVLLISKQPGKYGFDTVALQQPLVYDEVALPSATDLEVIAKLAGSDYRTIKQLNPELKRWSTPPGERGYLVRLPKGSYRRFVDAYAALDPAERVKYLRHRVKPGDTLLSLSKRHHVRVNDIIALNAIRNPRALKIGSDLILPLKKGYTRRPLDELRDDYVRSYRRSYKVRNGDSLWSIAKKFNVTQKELRVWNRLGWSNLIHPGQTLVVSSKGAGGKRLKKHRGPLKRIVYRVRAGDSLWTIGRRYDVPTRQILAWNNLAADHILHPGDKLTLLVPAG